MRTSSNVPVEKNEDDRPWQGPIARALWPRLVELWIFAVLAVFLVIRVLGSHAGQQLLSDIQQRRLP